MEALINGTVLHYTEHGSGPPMLVLHGGLGLDHSYLRPWLDPLGAHARLLFLDLRGCGHSAPLGADEVVTHATWAEDADALRAHLGIPRWTVFGHSYGGFLALEYGLRFPERLNGLVLCSSGPAFAHAAVAMQNAQARATPEILSALTEGFSVPAPSDVAFERTWRTIAPLYLHRPVPEMLAAITDGIGYRAAASNASTLVCLPAFDVRDRLGEIVTPTLVLAGQHDWILPPEHGACVLAGGIPDADLVLFDHSGHFPFIEEPEAFLAAVARWQHGGA